MHIKAIIILGLAMLLNLGTALRTDVIREIEVNHCPICPALPYTDELESGGFPLKIYEQKVPNELEDNEVRQKNTIYAEDITSQLNILNFFLNWFIWIAFVGVGIFALIFALEVAGALAISILIIAYFSGYLKLIEIF